VPAAPTSTAAPVLAAGGASRFGGGDHKLRTVVDGRPLVRHAVDAALEARLDDLIVVTGAVDLADLLPPEAVVVHHDRWAEGIATSLQVGVRVAAHLGHGAVVVGLGDQVGIGPQVWATVAAAHDAPIAVATFEGDRRPPVRLREDVWPLLPPTGDEGARALMRRRPELVREVPCRGRAGDIDTLEDLAGWS
jgi:CTP:molybdopterin cytidylyltransferase MocA